MRILTTLICLTTMTVMANPKLDESISCKEVYNSIYFMLQQDLITNTDAQLLWLKHKENERKKEI